MKNFFQLIEKIVPDVFVALAAVTIFVFLGICVFLTLLIESWRTLKKRQNERRSVEIVRMPLLQAKKIYNFRPAARPTWPTTTVAQQTAVPSNGKTAVATSSISSSKNPASLLLDSTHFRERVTIPLENPVHGVRRSRPLTELAHH